MFNKYVFCVSSMPGVGMSKTNSLSSDGADFLVEKETNEKMAPRRPPVLPLQWSPQLKCE